MANYRKQHNGFVFRLKSIGLTSEEKFCINENLIQTNFKALSAAIRLKKEKDFIFCVHYKGLCTSLISNFRGMLFEHSFLNSTVSNSKDCVYNMIRVVAKQRAGLNSTLST